MPVPDHVAFGPSEPSGVLTYGAVRKLSGDDLLRALKGRLDTYFMAQVEELAKPLQAGASKVYSPFPLFLMTCVGIETLGKVFFTRAPRAGETKDDLQREAFLFVCNTLHKPLSRPLTKPQKMEYDALWGADSHKNATSVSQIIYRLGRNTMIHGYRGKGVFLTEDVSEWTLDDGAVVINPYWFWRCFVMAYSELWTRLHANKQPNNPMKHSAFSYIGELLG